MATETAILAGQEKVPVAILGGDGGGFSGGGGGGGGDGSFRGRPKDWALRTYLTGVWLALVSITMLFVAFTSSLIVRRGVSTDWQPTELPSLFWLNTAILLASSFTLDHARRALRDGHEGAFRLWWRITTVLGVAFLAGQAAAWMQLADRGVYLSTNPSSSFLYLMSGAHGLHLLGGVVALLYVLVRSLRPVPVSRIPVEVLAVYWHFMDGLWIYLLLVLIYWR